MYLWVSAIRRFKHYSTSAACVCSRHKRSSVCIPWSIFSTDPWYGFLFISRTIKDDCLAAIGSGTAPRKKWSLFNKIVLLTAMDWFQKTFYLNEQNFCSVDKIRVIQSKFLVESCCWIWIIFYWFNKICLLDLPNNLRGHFTRIKQNIWFI